METDSGAAIASRGNDTGSGCALPVDAAMTLALGAGSCVRKCVNGWTDDGHTGDV